mmetsp:Transcript_101004/g.271546  ORF Transcript_101004/g.271546 Transcript_101004/m.271546 type:complete len:81 (-) Transcript_101004:722-964(-)
MTPPPRLRGHHDRSSAPEEEGEEEEEEEDSKGGYAEALVASQHPPLRLRDEAAHAAGAPRLRPWAPPQPGSRELLMEDTS